MAEERGKLEGLLFPWGKHNYSCMGNANQDEVSQARLWK